jgi:hypothetical protein
MESDAAISIYGLLSPVRTFVLVCALTARIPTLAGVLFGGCMKKLVVLIASYPLTLCLILSFFYFTGFCSDLWISKAMSLTQTYYRVMSDPIVLPESEARLICDTPITGRPYLIGDCTVRDICPVVPRFSILGITFPELTAQVKTLKLSKCSQIIVLFGGGDLMEGKPRKQVRKDIAILHSTLEQQFPDAPVFIADPYEIANIAIRNYRRFDFWHLNDNGYQILWSRHPGLPPL